MSDLLIKNMDMPKSCLGELTGKNDCPIVGICSVFLKTPFRVKEEDCWSQRLDGCPLVEIKSHGRCIDANELSYRTITDYNLEGHNVVDLEDIENAPTILEASE